MKQDEENPSPPLYLDMVRKMLVQKGNHDKVFATWYDNKGRAVKEYTFGQMWHEAGCISHYLRRTLNLSKKDRVVLCYDFGLHFLVTFLGCLRAGVTAVLVYPPSPPLTKSLASMNRVVKDCRAAAILCDSKIDLLRKADKLNPLSKSRSLWPDAGLFKVTDTTQVLKKICEPFDELVEAEDLAFLQYTSGSTGEPKGVMISHRNLHANVDDMLNVHFKRFPKVVGFSWLPQYHDAGLLCYLDAFAGAMRFHYMSPVTFIQNPLLWIRLLNEHRVTVSIAPDFAYNLVARRFSQALESGTKDPIPGLDLSCVESLISCAEPIRRATVENFTQAFGPYGLPDDWLAGCYGMAESVVFVSVYYGYRCSTPRNDDDGISHVAVGHLQELPAGVSIKIIDPDTNREVDEGGTGEVWLSSPSVAQGYFHKPELTQQTFEGILDQDPTHRKYLRTGDHAFVQENYLYICGRIKDLVIVNGVNKYPQDIEDVVQNASSAVRPGCVAAFSSDGGSDDGGLEIVFEIRKHSQAIAEEDCSAIQLAVSSQCGLKPYRVIAIAERQICKTTSGKIRRKATKAALHEGRLPIVASWSSLTSIQAATEQKDAYSKTKMSIDDLLEEFLGQEYDPNLEWEVLGVSSLTMVELAGLISEACLVTMPSDCFEIYRTPGQLKEFVHHFGGKPFETVLPPLESIGGVALSWNWIAILQAFGVILLLVVFAVPVLPAYYAGQYMATEAAVELATIGSVSIKWLWVPVAIPTWMLGLTILVLVSKWIAVGRYREGEMPTTSLAFVRWWWVDRAMHLWEFWVGRFILNTPLIWIFYRLMGAQIHPSVKIDGFVREPDLVSIGQDASLEQQLRCRKFGQWIGGRGPTLCFRRVVIQRDCRIRGMVSPGATIREGSIVKRRSVVPEGASLPPLVIASGNPAFSMGKLPKIQHRKSYRWLAVGLLKVLWLIIELYIFYGSMVVGRFIWTSRLPEQWSLTPFLFWFLLLATSSIISLFVGIPIKWLLIGRRKPGPSSESLWREAADWAADYHFRISISLPNTVASGSVIWNLILKLYGMDIDFESKVYSDFFPPSKVDLISVKRTFVSFASFDTKTSNGEYKRTVLSDSSLAFNVHVDPGVRIAKAVVKPCAAVTKDLIYEDFDKRFSAALDENIVRHKILFELTFLCFLLLVLASFLPAYFVCRELWVHQEHHPFVAVPILCLAITLQTLSWIVLLRMWQYAQVLYGYREKPVLSNVYCLPHCRRRISKMVYTAAAMGYSIFWHCRPDVRNNCQG